MKGRTTKWWVIAFVWCVLIALATRSAHLTGASTEGMLENPLFDSSILNYFLRKLTHIIAFGMLAVLYMIALRDRKYKYILAWFLATFYGAIDEWHQSFIPERSALVSDVLFDSFGALIALFIFYKVRKYVKSTPNDFVSSVWYNN